MATVPSKIYKYEAFTLRSIQNLKASSLYFGSPKSFNDPYDCAIVASIAPTTREELENLRSVAITTEAYPEHVRRAIPKLTLEEFEAQIRRGALTVIDNAREDFLRTKGVSCFSETNDHLLMWSHYGGQYKGMCLEFRTEFALTGLLRKVKYVETMPQFELSDFVLNKNHEKLLDLFLTKSKAWEYELEWRAMHAVAGTMYGYEPEWLSGVYFGPDIPEQDRDLVCQILYCQFPTTQIWIGRRSTEAFKVEFDKTDGYTPHAEAKRRGLV